MKIPFRPSRMKLRRGKPQWIILHHTVELYEQPEAKIDNAKFQYKALTSGVLEKKHPDVNYHFVIEKIGEDYTPLVCRPFVYLCEWDDISNDINDRALHVALLGSYDFKIPEARCYGMLAYKVLNPMLRMWKLPPSRIKFHRDVSSEDITCPGDFVDRAVVEAQVRRFVTK